MLGKLIKYEWKATARMFLPFYAAILVFSLINRLFLQFSSGVEQGGLLGIPSTIAMMVYVMVIIATFALTLIVMVQRFYKSLLGDEGYLMFTLPVKTREHIFSKLLVSAAWIVISVAVTLVSLFFMLAKKGFFAMISNGYAKMVQEIHSQIPLNFGLLFAWLIAAVVISLITSILLIYASVALGQLFSRHKLAASFGAFLVLSTISQILSSVLLAIVYAIDPNSIVNNTIPSSAAIYLMMFGVLALNALIGTAYYFVTNYILTKKLNLE